MIISNRRYVNQEIWKDSNLAIYLTVALFCLAVSCMFVTMGFVTGSRFGLYIPLIAAAMLLLGGYYETHPIPRAVAWSIAWIIIALSGLFGIIGSFSTDGATFAGVSNSPILVCFGLLILPTIGVGYTIWQAILRYRQTVEASLGQMLIDLVELRHDLSFAEADEELKIGKTAVLHHAETLHEQGRLTGAVDPTNERLYSLTGLAAKQEQIASVIQAQGQITLQDLSREMRVPEDLLKKWLFQLVRLGHFSGYVDWQSNTVYSRQRDQPQQNQTCPNCAAELKIAGQGIIGCDFCQAEIFV